MLLVIHKGSHEIGGNCIELSHDGCSILLDIGQPLDPESVPAPVQDMEPAAVVVSHPHMDHYGLIDVVRKGVPIYLGGLSHSLIDAARLFTARDRLSNDITHITAWQEFEIGPFKISSYLMDHSSPEAFAFLIEADGKRVFYTGDFRAHGRKGKVFEKLIQSPPENIDAIIMEGTMMGRSNDDFPDETSVEDKILEVIRDQDSITFLLCSSQNIDRVVGAFRACKKAGKTMVVDAYTAWVLEKMKQVSKSVPEMSWDQVRVYVPKNQYDVIKEHSDIFGTFRREIFQKDVRIEAGEIHDRAKDILFIARPSMYRTMDRHLKTGPINVIYSMWLGYLEDERYVAKNRRVCEYRTDQQVNFNYAHTSGHAPVEDLKRLVDAIQPKQLYPVHTELRDKFSIFPINVIDLEDGTIREI